MTSFCVFGVSRQICREQAEKKVPTEEKNAEGKTVSLTAPEWGERVKEKAEEIFDTSDKQKKISPVFDAPQFCRDWLGISPEQVRLTKIMVRGPKLDDEGNEIRKKGAPVMTWLPYEGKS